MEDSGMYNQQLLSKQGEITILLAKMFLKMTTGDRMPSNQELSRSLNAGIGTIQSALKFFVGNGNVKLTSRGHQGTVIDYINYVTLFRYNDVPWIFGAMPLPYSIILEGLATGLYSNSEKHELLLKMSYIRGSQVRINRLLTGNVDFIVCSKKAADIAIGRHPRLKIITSFGENTYVGKSGIIFSDSRHKEIKDNMKIGIDEDSLDHVYLNQIVCEGHSVEFIKLKYSEIFSKLKSKEIDATVWAFDEAENTEFKKSLVIPRDKDMLSAMSASQEAVIVMIKDHFAGNLLSSVTAPKEIKKIQDKVINKELVPSY